MCIQRSRPLGLNDGGLVLGHEHVYGVRELRTEYEYSVSLGSIVI